MNIVSGAKYPASALSNFAGHRFILDGVRCHSMEGFLQSLKFKNPLMQKEICKLVGLGAKRRGAGKNWQQKQVLYWKGVEYKRDSEEYTQLIERAYNAMFEQSESFRKALAASGNQPLSHTIGRRKKSETVLTQQEFISNLHRVRDRLEV